MKHFILISMLCGATLSQAQGYMLAGPLSVLRSKAFGSGCKESFLKVGAGALCGALVGSGSENAFKYSVCGGLEGAASSLFAAYKEAEAVQNYEDAGILAPESIRKDGYADGLVVGSFMALATMVAAQIVYCLA